MSNNRELAKISNNKVQLVCLPFYYQFDITHSGGGGDEFTGWFTPPLFDENRERTQRMLFSLSPVVAGQGRVETTFASPKLIALDDDTLINVNNWPQGNVNVATQDDSLPLTFRLAVQSGTIRLEVKVI